ncbi:MAG TPA: AMP-binding protein [Pseudonocardia sp.]|jgi:crotonobetaine/carnitine-CoA ligase|nr:AMP-binding protein [Pseudonocardia sp.]
MDRPLPPLAERTVQEVLADAVRNRPSAPALRDPDRALSYAETDKQARVFAGGISALGAGAGRRVLLMLDNHVDYVLCWLGVTLAGGVEVPINTAYQGDLLVHVINDSEAEHLIIEDRYCSRIAAIRHELKSLRTIVVRGGDGGEVREGSFTVVAFSDLTDASPVEPQAAQPWDLLAIMYTSGTTGPSKGVLVTQSHAYGYCSPALYGAATQNDTVLVTLPLFHVGGQWAGVYNALIAGAEAVVLDRFHATTYWEDVRRYGATYTLMLGAMAGFLHRQPPRSDDADNPMRRALMVPVIPEFSDFADRFGIAIGTAYGSTEASTSVYTPFGAVESVACGTARPDFDVKIVDENDIDVPTGRIGELVLRPSEPWSIMAGYHGRPEATAAAWRNQWMHTGDAFSQDEQGRLFFVDRLSDSIRRRGENISSFEVERAVDSHSDVLESAVVGVASEFTEQDVLAAVVLRPGASVTEPELWAHLADRLPYFMVPRYIEFVGELPKTPTQKLQKNVIRAGGVTAAAWDHENSG